MVLRFFVQSDLTPACKPSFGPVAESNLDFGKSDLIEGLLPLGTRSVTPPKGPLGIMTGYE